MQDGVYRYRQDAMHPLVYSVKIEGGVIVDAWVYQAQGEYRSSGGWERSVIGKRADDVDLTGYVRRG